MLCRMLPVEYMIKSKQASAIRLLRVFRLMKLAKVSVHASTSTSRRRSYAVKSSSITRQVGYVSTKLQTVIKYCVVLIVIVHWTACALKLVTDCVEINQCVGCRQFFTKSFLGDGVADLARSSGEEPASPRHRAGVASMASRSTNAP